MRLGRLNPNTSYPATCLNGYLTEASPAHRVLTGEVIVFQNETIELFRELINTSESPLDKKRGGPLRLRYVYSVIMEFVQALFDNGIHLQPQLQ